MAEPLCALQQMQQNLFTPDKMIVIYFAVDKFDAVQKPKNGRRHQFYSDLGQCKKDIETMQEILDHYQISEADIKYHLVEEEATEAEFNRIYLDI